MDLKDKLETLYYLYTFVFFLKLMSNILTGLKNSKQYKKAYMKNLIPIPVLTQPVLPHPQYATIF